MGIEKGLFNRTRLLVGDDMMELISRQRVIIFGVGGVGSWCAESLVRSGIGHLTIVDSDRVCMTNVNRQLQATSKTVGKVKVDVLRERLLEINPTCDVVALQKIYSEDTAPEFNLDDYDYVIDCIDSLKDKVLLIHRATSSRATIFSSMGAALKMDPTKIQVAEFWKVRGCPLGAALRKRFKRMKVRPAHKFQCVYSEEVLENRGENHTCGTSACMCPKAEVGPGDPSLVNHEWCSSKAQINGTMAHITAIFGFTIAGLVMNHLYHSAGQNGK